MKKYYPSLTFIQPSFDFISPSNHSSKQYPFFEIITDYFEIDFCNYDISLPQEYPSSSLPPLHQLTFDFL